MALRDLLTKVDNWWSDRIGRGSAYPSIDREGLLCEETAEPGDTPSTTQTAEQGREMAVKKNAAIDRKEKSIEMLGEGFNKLIEQLQGINKNLIAQAAQHEELMSRIDQLPDLLESLPGAVNNQRQVVEALTEQLKTKAVKDQLFIETVEKIPAETTRQTNALIEMNQKLSVATDIDAQMTESFNKFNETLKKLDENTVDHTNGIAKMSKTFAASDRYLKYIISRQHKRFMWVFITAMSVCAFAIITLLITVIIVAKR